MIKVCMFFTIIAAVLMILSLACGKVPRSHFVLGSVLMAVMVPLDSLNLLLAPDNKTAWFYFGHMLLVFLTGGMGCIMTRQLAVMSGLKTASVYEQDR